MNQDTRLYGNLSSLINQFEELQKFHSNELDLKEKTENYMDHRGQEQKNKISQAIAKLKEAREIFDSIDFDL